MKERPPYAYGSLVTGSVLTGITGLALVILSFVLTKRELFLLMNDDLGRFADYVFTVFTHLGDGTVWIPVAIIVYLYRKDRFLLLFCMVIIGTLIVQSLKNVFIPAQVRPGTLITDHTLFHSVEWVPLLTNYSFPSGHTTTAFSIFLLGCLLIPKKWVLPIGFIYACLVAYSRVYLAEHFPLDLGGGMLTAVATAWVSLLIQRAWDRRRKKKLQQ